VVGASEPEQVIEHFMKLFNSGDMEGLLDELYEDDAVLLPGPGAPLATGKPAIREVLQAFLDMGGTMSLVAATAIPRGDLALTHSTWRLEVPGSDAMQATTAEVVRRQPDGSWRYIIDNPFGGAVLDPAP
jgi:ketosteroid isomerase-like protein